jgi:hypothetical protein
MVAVPVTGAIASTGMTLILPSRGYFEYFSYIKIKSI